MNAPAPLAGPRRSAATLPPAVEWLLLAGIVAVGAWLRFQHPELLEFKSDEAYAANQALEFVHGGKLPASGLMSSVGVSNPPLFIWLMIPLFFLSSNIAVVCGMISVLGLAAVVATWWIGRKYHGSLCGLIAAALFATSPWAVVYSRKIWAQDFVPVLATGAMWAAYSLVLGKNPKAVFWLLCLPLSVIQIHFSGFALTAAAVAILVLLRPKVDWRFAAGGVAVAVLLALPYIAQQQKNGWAEWKRLSEERSSHRWERLPPGRTINPQSGYPFPRRPTEAWRHALAIMNAGEIEDILGLSASEAFDPIHIWAAKHSGQNRYFDTTLTLGDWLPGLQQLAFCLALLWFGLMAIESVKSLFRRQVTMDEESKSTWILVLWIVVPLVAYLVAGLWTYLSYYVILYPVYFLVLGALARRAIPRGILVAVIAAFLLGNIVYMQDLNRYLAQYGGAQGTYGSGLGYKQAAAKFAAAHADVRELVRENRLLQVDQLQQGAQPAQLDLPFLALQHERGNPLPTNQLMLVVDDNRTGFDASRMNFGATGTNFGPMRIYVLNRP